MSSTESPNLRLVPDDEAVFRRRRVREWLLDSAPDPLPDNSDIVLRLDGCPRSERDDFEVVAADLVKEGQLFRIQIGPTPHLTRSPGRSPFSAFDEERHRIEVRLDLESERQLLFRLALVLEFIGTLLFFRHWLLNPEVLTQLLLQ